MPTKPGQRLSPQWRERMSASQKKAWANGRACNSGGENSKAVAAYDVDTGNLIGLFPSSNAAARFLNCYPSNILRASKGEVKTSHGFVWKLLEELPDDRDGT